MNNIQLIQTHPEPSGQKGNHMDSIVQKLFEEIQNKTEYWGRQREIFGEDHYITLATFHEIIGMEKAFKIIAGMSAAQYLIKTSDE